MSEKEWVKLPDDWDRSAKLPSGTRCKFSGRATEFVLSSECSVTKGEQRVLLVQLPPGYRFEGSEVVKEEAKPNYCHNRHGAYTQLCDESCREAHGQFQYGTCPECAGQRWNPSLDRCDHCGATAKSIEAKRARPACKCGATENVRVVSLAGRHQCGPCYQAQRRAELQAQKLEQTKRDMSRPVKRDPYEWLGFSSADWEE